MSSKYKIAKKGQLRADNCGRIVQVTNITPEGLVEWKVAPGFTKEIPAGMLPLQQFQELFDLVLHSPN